MSDTQLIDLFVTALHSNPAADPPPSLDPATARAIRAAVLAGRRDPPDAAVKSRLWKTALDAAQLESTPPDNSRPNFSANGNHKEDPSMTSLSIPRPATAAQRLRPLTLAAVLALLLFSSVLIFQVFQPEASGPVVSFLSNEEANRMLFERYINEAWNAGDDAILDKLLSDDHVYHDAVLGDLVGLKELAAHIAAFRATYPGAQFAITSIGATDADVWAHVVVSNAEGVPPELMLLVRFDEGQIVEQWAQQITSSGNIVVGPGCTLVDAINAANSNEVVGNCVAGNSIALDVIDLTGDVVLSEADNREDGANALPSITSEIVIQGNGYTISRDEEGENFRFFHVAEDGDLTLENVIVTNGLSVRDGSTVLNRGKLVVRNCTFTENGGRTGHGGVILNETEGTTLVFDTTFEGNQAGNGGAIYSDGTLTVHHSDFTGNSATFSAGALAITGSPSTVITNSTFVGNSTVWAGAIAVRSFSNLYLLDSLISGNTAKVGSGLFNDLQSNTVIIRSTITDNWTSDASGYRSGGGDGGGIINYTSSTLTLIDSTVANNRAHEAAGGIYNEDNSTLTISGSTITGNSAAVGGGVLSFNNSKVTIENSTICGNTAIEHGGGIVNADGPAMLTNSTVCDNVAPTAGGIGNGFDLPGYPNTGGGVITLYNTIVTNNDGEDCVLFDDEGTFSGSANRDSDGSCPDSAVLTGFEDGQVVAGSNAIDAGDSTFCPETDQHGAPRDELCDIGAVEFGAVVGE